MNPINPLLPGNKSLNQPAADEAKPKGEPPAKPGKIVSMKVAADA